LLTGRTALFPGDETCEFFHAGILDKEILGLEDEELSKCNFLAVFRTHQGSDYKWMRDGKKIDEIP
jgi:hypothetical protein